MVAVAFFMQLQGLLLAHQEWDSLFTEVCGTGEPVAFFVEHNGDSVDHFVGSILQTGFGTGGEAAEIKILNRLLQVNMHAT